MRQVMPSANGSGPVTSSTLSAMTVRLIRTCLAIVVVFTLCWVPLQVAIYVLNLVQFYGPLNLLRWLTIFSCFNSCVNPIIYGLMWRPFRTALLDVSMTYT